MFCVNDYYLYALLFQAETTQFWLRFSPTNLMDSRQKLEAGAKSPPVDSKSETHS